MAGLNMHPLMGERARFLPMEAGKGVIDAGWKNNVHSYILI